MIAGKKLNWQRTKDEIVNKNFDKVEQELKLISYELISGGDGMGNLDGGVPDSDYGGIDPIDANGP